MSKSKSVKLNKILLATALAVVAIASVATFAANPKLFSGQKSEVTVKVVSYNGNMPLQGVTVKAYTKSTKYLGISGKTDSAGLVTLSGVPYGENKFHLSLRDYRDSYRLYTVDEPTEFASFIHYPNSSF